jgi:arylsulfatase A-like enzyme
VNISRFNRSFLVAFIVLAVISSRAAAVKPNIIFLLADDLGYMDIGANNPKTFYETPNIDKLARQGMRFTQGYAACCVCSPTRASIMTGKYPPRVHITDYIGGARRGKLLPAPYDDHLALGEVTIAKALRDAGYTNFFAGKWHLGTGAYSPNAFGFGPGLVAYNTFYYPPGNVPKPNDRNDGKTTDYIAEKAVDFIHANRDHPFFAYLPFQAPHIPVRARPDLVAKYKQKAVSAPADLWGKEGTNKVRLVQNHAAYAAMVEQMDSAIGRVLDAVDRDGLADRTIVIFFSDNGGLSTAEGWPTSNLPLRAGKGWPYEGGIREPLIIAAPGVTAPGSVCETPVISIDFYPTLLDLGGLPPMPTQHRDGADLVPLLKGSQIGPRDLFWHYPHYGNQGGAPCSTIRSGDWKLIEWFEDKRLELFNLASDLGESNNVAAEHPEVVKTLHARLIAWRKEVGALLPTPNPEAVEKPQPIAP